MPEKKLEDTVKFAELVSNKQGWELNSDKDFLDSLIAGLTTNWNRYGYYLCPCRDSDGSRKVDADIICPCKYSWADIEEHGHCFCALYMCIGFAASGKEASGIPDRRFS